MIGDESSFNYRLTVAQAAAVLGTTPEAVRNRLRRGTLKKEKDADGSVYVLLDPDQRPSKNDASVDQTAIVRILEERIADLQRQRDAWMEEAKRKDHLLAALIERVPELEAPPET